MNHMICSLRFQKHHLTDFGNINSKTTLTTIITNVNYQH